MSSPGIFTSRSTDVYNHILERRADYFQNNIAGKEMWLNETNVPGCGDDAVPNDFPPPVSCGSGSSFPGFGTMTEQASFIIQAIAYAFDVGATKVFQFQMEDDGNGEAFGMFRNDQSRRPIYLAYQLTAQYLEGFDQVQHSSSKGAEFMTFHVPGDDVPARDRSLEHDRPAVNGDGTGHDQSDIVRSPGLPGRDNSGAPGGALVPGQSCRRDEQSKLRFALESQRLHDRRTDENFPGREPECVQPAADYPSHSGPARSRRQPVSPSAGRPRRIRTRERSATRFRYGTRPKRGPGPIFGPTRPRRRCSSRRLLDTLTCFAASARTAWARLKSSPPGKRTCGPRQPGRITLLEFRSPRPRVIRMAGNSPRS